MEYWPWIWGSGANTTFEQLGANTKQTTEDWRLLWRRSFLSSCLGETRCHTLIVHTATNQEDLLFFLCLEFKLGQLQ